MEKFKSLLSFTLGICLTSTAFKVFSNSLSLETDSKRQISVAEMNEKFPVSAPITAKAGDEKHLALAAITTDAGTPVSTIMSEETTKAIETAGAAEAEKNWDKAISIYKEEIAKDSNRPDLWKRIADIENTQQHYQNAIDSLKNAIKLKPKDAQLYVSLSETYAVNNQSKEALSAINQALQIEPMNVDYLNRRAILADWSEQHDQAEDSYKRMLSIDPNNQTAQAGLENIKTEKANVKKSSTSTPVSKAITANTTTPVAVVMSEEAKKAAPVTTPVFVAMSEEAAKTDSVSTPVSAIISEKAPEVAPPATTPVSVAMSEEDMEVIKAGSKAEEAKDWNKAISIYKEAIDKDPNRPDLWKKIADDENAQQHYQNAIDALNKAIKLQPNNAQLYATLSETYAVTNQSKEALTAINQALQIEPMNVDYLNRRVVLAHWVGDYDQIEDSYKRILKIEPNNQVARLGLENVQAEKTKVQGTNGKPPASGETTVETSKSNTDNKKPFISPGTTAKTPKQKSSPSATIGASAVDEEGSVSADRTKEVSNNEQATSRVSGAGYAKQAQKYSEANRYQEALAYINLAIINEPNNMKYYKLQGEIAIAAKDYALARESYSRMLQIQPHNKDALLGIASLEIERNDLNAAARAYENYLYLYPDSKTVWLDYAKSESWRGNYASAFHLLREYSDRYGETYEYLSEKARLFEMAGYPEHALCLVKDLLVKSPHDYELLFTQAAALQGNREPREAVKALYEIERDFPKKTDNKDLRSAVWTPNRSNLSLDGYFSHDSDEIKIFHSGISGQYFITPETSLIYGVKEENLTAVIDSGLDTIDGHARIWDTAQWVGLTHQICPELAISGLAGAGEIKKIKGFFRYDLNINANPNDYIQIGLQKGQDLYSLSPRAVSLRILQRYNRADLNWQLYPQRYLSLGGEYDHFSDSNKMKSLYCNPYMVILASQYLDIDFGPYANWQKFSLQPSNGYYSPSLVQLYQAMGHFTIKQSDNINYVLTLAAGTQKDETMLKPGFAGDIALRAIYGIYADWQLNVSAGATARNSGALLEGSGTKYRVYSIEALLTKRF